MSKSYCVWGYCDHMLVPALVDGVFKFLFEILKFALLLVATFWLAVGIFQWWDYAASPVCTNFGLQPSSVSLKDPECKKPQKASGAALKKSKTADSNVSDDGFIICSCGRRVQKGIMSQTIPAAQHCQIPSRHVLPSVQQVLPASNCAAPYRDLLKDISSTEMRTGPAQPSRAASSSGPCDGPNIAQIYSELLKQNAMQMYMNEMRQIGLSEELLEKIKRANLTTAAPLVEGRTYPGNNSQLATTSPLVSKAELLMSPKQTSAINCDLSYSAVAYNRDGSLRSSSNEDNVQLPAQIQKLNRNVNVSNITNESPSSLHATLPQSVSKVMPAPSNTKAGPKDRDSEARVCRCRNPKCKRRVQLY